MSDITSDMVAQMAQQRMWGWTDGQIARWHGVERAAVRQLTAHGFPAFQLPACGGCGKPFMPSSPSARYCSDRCQRKAQNQRAKERAKDKAEPIPCPTCGELFRPHAGQRYCSNACKPQSVAKAKPLPPDPRSCAECGKAFLPKRTDEGRGVYCSLECKNKANQITVKPRTKRGETAAIVPSSESSAKLTHTDEQFWAELASIRAQRLRDGLPLVDRSQLACTEKAAREAAAQKKAA